MQIGTCYNIGTMASGLTPTYSLPYPLATDGVNVHGDVADLAQKVEDILEVKANVLTSNNFTSPNSVTVDTSTTAFRVTQTGGGNIFVAENAASPDPTPFVINAQGAVGVNVLLPQATLHVDGEMILTGQAIFDAGIQTTEGVFSGALVTTDQLGGNSVYSETNYKFLDSFSGVSMNLNKPATIFVERNIDFPDTDGTVITTGNLVEAYPSQTGNAGSVLTTDGSVVSWAVAPNQVPDVANNAGKFLGNDGSTYYWQDIVLVPDISTDPINGTTGKWLTNTGSSPFWDYLPTQTAFIDINSSFVATGNVNLFCDTLTYGSFTVTLPTSPLPGMQVAIFDVKNNFVNDYVIIDSGTVLLNGKPGPLNIDISGATVVFIYINELIGWRLA